MATSKMLGGSQHHDFTCSPCSEDGKNSEALYHCNICQTFYCQRCVDVHNKFTKNHSVTDKSSDKFGQGLGKSATSSSDMPTDLCEEHHGEVVKMFCAQHDAVCCTVCIAVKHRSCEGVEYIPNIARGLLEKQGKEKTKHSLEKVKADLEDLKSKMENGISLDEQRERIIDDIQEFKRRIIARVEELERTSLKEMGSKHKELADEMNTYSKKIDGLLKVIDTRLNKLNKDSNEAQQFVDVKNGEKEAWQGVDLVKHQTSLSSGNKKAVKFEMNTDIDECLRKEQSLGSLKECPTVNIVCPVETDITKAFVSELQAKLKTYDIGSEYTGLKEIIAGRYTIVLCEYDDMREAEQITTGIQDNTIILMSLLPMGIEYIAVRHQRQFIEELLFHYEIKQDFLHRITFPVAINKQEYETCSNIVNGSKQ